MIGVAYEHNINEMKALLSACNVDLSYVEIKIDSLVANADIDMQAIAKSLMKTRLHTTSPMWNTFIPDGSMGRSHKDRLFKQRKVQRSDRSRQPQIRRYFSQMPFSIGGGDYYFYG